MKRFGSRMVPRTLASGMLALCATGFIGAGVSGCDTVARIAIIPNDFQGIDGIWYAPAADAANNEFALGSGNGVLRFILQSSEDQPVTENTTFGGLEIGLTRQDVSLDGGTLFTYPDELCSGSCDQDQSFSCAIAASAVDQAEFNRCLKVSGISVTGDPVFVSDISSNQLLGILMENTSSLRGALPETVLQQFADLDGDGLGDGTAPIELERTNRERATDRDSRRQTMLLNWRVEWNRLRSEASNDRQVRTLFGLWTFSGSKGTINSLVDGGWTEAERGASAAVTEYQRVGDAREDTQAAVFESMSALMRSEEDAGANGFARADVASYDKQMIVFVDGPDELRLPSIDAQRVIEDAQREGVKIFIVHLDSAIATQDASGRPIVVDDPTYVENQPGYDTESECDCKNFEECRTVTAYSASPGDTVAIPSQGVDKLYCVPSRDANGRIGPIDDYARIASATGGGYIYLTEAEGMAQQVKWLPYALDGTWELPVSFDAVSRGTVDGGGMYGVSSVLSVTVDDSTNNFAGTLGATVSSAQVDNRNTILVGESSQ